MASLATHLVPLPRHSAFHPVIVLLQRRCEASIRLRSFWRCRCIVSIILYGSDSTVFSYPQGNSVISLAETKASFQAHVLSLVSTYSPITSSKSTVLGMNSIVLAWCW